MPQTGYPRLSSYTPAPFSIFRLFMTYTLIWFQPLQSGLCACDILRSYTWMMNIFRSLSSTPPLSKPILRTMRHVSSLCILYSKLPCVCLQGNKMISLSHITLVWFACWAEMWNGKLSLWSITFYAHQTQTSICIPY